MKRDTVDPLAFPKLTSERRSEAERVAAALRGRRVVSDDAFDAIYPSAVRRASAVHWTPMRVCARIVHLLELGPGQRLLDLGAGAGKFCIVAAAMSGASVCGVEREPYLAEVAREAADRLGIGIDIVEGTFDAKDAEYADVNVVYLFNPFAETLFLPGVGELMGVDAARTAGDVATAEAFLTAARVGTRVVTYCGFGGNVPSSYGRRVSEPCGGGALEIWERERGDQDEERPAAHGEPLPNRALGERESHLGGGSPQSDVDPRK